jgi:pilus assembly protein FimV
MQHRISRISSIAVVAALLAAAPARAAELGDIAVRTYLNQPLTADIELVMLSPDEAAEGVPVRLAGANIYQGANVRMHPALAGARMSVQRKEGRLFVHIVTLQPVDTEVVHLFLELGSGSRAVVRAATVWLTPEPPGAPRPPVVRPLPATAAASPAVEGVPAARTAAAVPVRPAPLPPPVDLPPPPKQAMAAALPTAAPPLSAPSASSAAAPVTADPSLPGFAPSEAALVAARARTAAEREAQARRAVRAGHGAGGILGTMPPRGVPGAAACAPGQAGDQARQCVALDRKNTELNAKIHDLESKVQALQSAMGTPAPAQAASGAAPAAAATPASGAAASAASGASPAASAAASHPAAAASAAMNPAGSVIPPSRGTNGANGTNGKKERRSGLNATTQIVLGVVAAIAVLGGLVYLVRKKKLKLSLPKEKLMFWKRWRRNKDDQDEALAEPQEPVMDKEGESAGQ